MERRRFAAALAAGLTTGLAGCRRETEPTMTDETLDNGSFEDGLSGWTVGSDLPADPSAGGDRPVDSDVTVTSERASNGTRSCALFLDGRQAEGTLWVQQRASLSGDERLAVDYYSERESVNTVARAAVYAGPVPDDGLAESDFDTTRAVEDHSGWRSYEYDVSHDGTGLVAVGISVAWETEMTRFLDNVRLR